MIWYSHLFQNFPQFIVIHTVKAFGIVNKAEVDVFMELSCFFDDPADVGNLISGSSAFSKSSLNIWKFTVHIRMSQIRAKKCLRINVGRHCLHVGRPCYLWMEFCSSNSSFSEQSFFFFFLLNFYFWPQGGIWFSLIHKTHLISQPSNWKATFVSASGL